MCECVNIFSRPTLQSFSILLALFSSYFHEASPSPKLISRVYETNAFGESPALQRISNVAYYHANRLNINLCLGSHRQGCKCLQWALFPRPITPPHSPELNFTPVIMAIWSDSNLGARSVQQICAELQP